MQGRPAQVARGLSTIAARIVKNQDALAEYGITVENVDGSLKSTYDILAELKPKWDEMTDAQRTALGDTLAGTNQYKVLASVMQNFDSALTATQTAYNSAGSAAKENERYMESLEAQTQNLKATFQDFANNVITKDMISSLLNLANAFLELANTPIGRFATQVVLFTTALTGLKGVLSGYLAFIKGGGIFKSLTNGIVKLSGVVGPGVTIVEALATGWKNLLVTLGPAAAIFAALAVAIELSQRKFNDYNAAIEKTISEQDKLASYKDEMTDLESRTDSLTDAERHRLEVLKEITAEQEKAVQAAKEAEYAAYSAASGSGANAVVGGGTGVGGGLGVGALVTQSLDANRLADYRRELESLNHEYESGTMVTGEYYAAMQALNDGYADNISIIRDFIESGIAVTENERELVLEYDKAQTALGNVGTSVQIVNDAYEQLTRSGEISKSTWQTLIAYYPQLANGAVQTANGYQVQQSALERLMSAETRQQAQITNVVNGLVAEAQQAGYTGQALYDLVAAQIQASNTGLNFTQQIAALQQLAYQAGLTAQQVAAAMGMTSNTTQNARNRERTIQSYMQKGMSRSQAEAKYLSEMQRNLSYSIGGNWSTSFGGSSVSVPSVSVPSTSTGSSKKAASDSKKRSETQSEIKALQNERDQIQDTIDKINEKYDAQIDALEKVNDALEDEIELQKILEEMAKAKSTKKMVYKDGRFQYVDDLDAVANVQTKLDEYNRKKAIKDQKAYIEQKRQLELKSYKDRLSIIEASIKSLQNGLSSEIGVWDDYLDQLQTKINQENAIIASRNTTIDTGGSTGGSTSGGGSIWQPDESTVAPSTITRNRETASKYPRNKGYSSAHNAEYDASSVKKMQSWYGTSADGIWGQNSYAAAGNRNVDSAYGLYSAMRSKYSSFSAFKAEGGFAKGTLSAPGGLALVGEKGPELRVLNQGDGILPANITRNLMAMAKNPQLAANNGRSAQSLSVHVGNVTLPNVRNAEEFVSGLRNMALQRVYSKA